jgi:ABC-2 type transport system permease protein
LIQGFSMPDITLYIIMSFVTNLLTRSDSSFMIGKGVKDGSIIMRLLRPVHFSASYLFTELGSKWLIFISVGLPFLNVIILMKILSGQGIVEVLGLTILYLFSLTLAYLINFFFNICFGFTAFVFKNLWGPIYSRLP